MTEESKRQWIMDLIREEYDPLPNDYRPSEASNWDDGAGRIADAILARLDPQPASLPCNCGAPPEVKWHSVNCAQSERTARMTDNEDLVFVNLSLLDKTWNAAIEAAAKDCEQEALGHRSANGGGNGSESELKYADVLDHAASNIRKYLIRGAKDE